MNTSRHTILCVDDEKKILNSLKRLFRKENCRLLTASSGAEGLNILNENEVQLVLSDQRMPGMSGIEFMARVKDGFPDIIRIILTGYTEVDAITESINKGHIYKFFIKPWDDQNLLLEIRNALEQYDLAAANKKLNKKVLAQNKELQRMNDNLENLVKKRTRDLEIQNRALEISRIILDNLPTPTIGVSSEGMIVMINKKASSLFKDGNKIEVGKKIMNYFPDYMPEKINAAISSMKSQQKMIGCHLSGKTYDMEITPLSRNFEGKGFVLTLCPCENQPRRHK